MTDFVDRVEVLKAGGCNVYTLTTPVSDIVTFRGSFRSGPDVAINQDLVQSLCVSTLDKGTHRRTKIEIAEVLENLGAQLHFYSDDLRVGFSGSVLRDDLPIVVDLLAEQLRSPAFAEAEFELVRRRAIASAQRSMERTADQADVALRRSLFDTAHPNYGLTPAETIALYEAVDDDAVRRYHEKHFGARDLNLVVVGDLDPNVVQRSVGAAFSDWPDHGEQERYTANTELSPSLTSFVDIPDRPNSDVVMGHTLSIRRDHPDFVPLYVGNYILGGNFSARLMMKIRDELGLTYGIRSSLTDVSVDYDGFWEVSVTLSADNVAAGTEETLAEVERFVRDGITDRELQDKKETIAGSFAVGLATTAGLARSILANIERGFGPGYLDRFPEEVRASTLDEVNAAISKYLHPAYLHVATAGSAPASASG
jgi:predicted Zn-dependent peptidase